MRPSITLTAIFLVWTFVTFTWGLPDKAKGDGDVMCFPVDISEGVDVCFDMSASSYEFVRGEESAMKSARAMLLSKLDGYKNKRGGKRSFDRIGYTTGFGRIG